MPVTGILYSTSCPGVTPVSDGPLMRGAGPGLGVRISRGSTGMSIATGAAPLTVNFASAQFAATGRVAVDRLDLQYERLDAAHVDVERLGRIAARRRACSRAARVRRRRRGRRSASAAAARAVAGCVAGGA